MGSLTFDYLVSGFPGNLIQAVEWPSRPLLNNKILDGLEFKGKLLSALESGLDEEFLLAEHRFADPVTISGDIQNIAFLIEHGGACIVIQIPEHRAEFQKSAIALATMLICHLFMGSNFDVPQWILTLKGVLPRIRKIDDDYECEILRVLAAEMYHLPPEETGGGRYWYSGITPDRLEGKIRERIKGFSPDKYRDALDRLCRSVRDGGHELLGKDKAKGIYFIL